LFEAASGSGLGARIDLDAPSLPHGAGAASRPSGKDLFFGEFIGSVLLEVSQDFRLDDVKLPHRVLGEVTTEPQLMLTAGGEEILTESLTALERSWAGTFREVLG